MYSASTLGEEDPSHWFGVFYALYWGFSCSDKHTYLSAYAGVTRDVIMNTSPLL